ncbi:MAG: hypothetical protein K0U84_14070 [Actinomycetia bacterium]|nr:hypothetical protein [Actinomycetes bacterium]
MDKATREAIRDDLRQTATGQGYITAEREDPRGEMIEISTIDRKIGSFVLTEEGTQIHCDDKIDNLTLIDLFMDSIPRP